MKHGDNTRVRGSIQSRLINECDKNGDQPVNHAMMTIVELIPTVLFSAEEPMRQLDTGSFSQLCYRKFFVK